MHTAVTYSLYSLAVALSRLLAKGGFHCSLLEGAVLNSNFTNLVRWYVKKLARSLVVNSTFVRTRLGRSLPHSPCVRVLTYHRFADEKRDPFCVSRADFDRQMALLASEGRAVSLSQVEAFLAGDTNLPEDACLVTIDDGMLSTLSEAMPVLEAHRVPATAFVSSKLVGLDLPDLPERYLTRDELRAVSESGMITIGSHAHTHRSMAELPAVQMREEARVSKELLTDYADAEVWSFAYPFGMQKDFSANTDQILSDVGYKIAFNSMHGAIVPGMSPVSLPRVKIEGGESLSMFAGISRGAMDDWRLVDEKLWRTQRVRREIA